MVLLSRPIDCRASFADRLAANDRAGQPAANIAIHPPKTELLTQRAPSVATGKALMESHEDAPPVELDLQDIRTKAALLAFLRSP